MIEAVLFDLDGTLIDTTPDMGSALNNLLIETGHKPIALEIIRPYISQGSLALTRLGFAEQVTEAELEPLRLRYLQHYRAIVADQSVLFDGMAQVLDLLEKNNLPWGIVTNKPEWLTTPLLQQLALEHRASVVICGDTLALQKPHPQPLIVAAETICVKCENCIYVGDDKRDIEAGNAANMTTLSATYNMAENPIDLHTWHADGNIDHPLDLLHHRFLINSISSIATIDKQPS